MRRDRAERDRRRCFDLGRGGFGRPVAMAVSVPVVVRVTVLAWCGWRGGREDSAGAPLVHHRAELEVSQVHLGARTKLARAQRKDCSW